MVVPWLTGVLPAATFESPRITHIIAAVNILYKASQLCFGAIALIPLMVYHLWWGFERLKAMHGTERGPDASQGQGEFVAGVSAPVTSTGPRGSLCRLTGCSGTLLSVEINTPVTVSRVRGNKVGVSCAHLSVCFSLSAFNQAASNTLHHVLLL